MEKSLKSHEFEWRPCHGSLLLVLRRDGAGFPAADAVEL